MLEAGVHFGHKTSRWSPKMRPFIWGAKNKVHLIDVSKAAILLERAGNFLKEVTSKGGKVLLVGTKKAAQPIIQKCADTTGMPFVIHRWVGGTLSNYEQVRKAVTRLLHMRDVVEKGMTHYKKKEISMIQKEIIRLEKNVGGIINFDYPPAALVVVDAKKEASAVKEASCLGIPVIALVDTNTDPEGVSIIIPSNDDSPKSISFLIEYLEGRIKEGVDQFVNEKAKRIADEANARKAAAEAKIAASKKVATDAANAAHAVAKEAPKAVVAEAPKKATAPTETKAAPAEAKEVKKAPVAAKPAAAKKKDA